jgi:hypothetical protein
LFCLFEGCRGDTGTAAVCSNGDWVCPSGTTDPSTCGGCTGNPPPDFVCGDGGWIRVDAGAGGAGGGGSQDGATDAPPPDAACGRLAQPCCANRTCIEGICYSDTCNT